MKKKKKGALSIEYLAGFVIVIVVVAIIIYWVSTRMSQGGEQINTVFDDNSDSDGDGILDVFDETPCGPNTDKTCITDKTDSAG